VEEAALDGRGFAVVGLAREVAGVLGLAGGFLDGEAGSGEAV